MVLIALLGLVAFPCRAAFAQETFGIPLRTKDGGDATTQRLRFQTNSSNARIILEPVATPATRHP